jgi:hypothetical protein
MGRPALLHNAVEHSPSFSSESSFEYVQPTAMTPGAPPSTMMMLPAPQQPQSLSMMQQQPPQQMMYRPVQMQSSLPPLPSSYIPQNYMYAMPRQGMVFGYHPMMQPGRMMPNGMPMMPAGPALASPTNSFSNQLSLFNPMAQQMVY